MNIDRATLTRREDKRVSIAILTEAKTSARQIEVALGIDISTVRYWGKRQVGGLDYIDSPRSGPQELIQYDSDDCKRLVAFYCQTAMLPNGHGKWTLRKAATYLKAEPETIGISPSKSTIQRVLAEENLKPHRTKYFLHITDPDFFPKMEHLLELRRDPPKHLFFFDECPGIHVRQRLSPAILSKISEKELAIWLEEFEYIRNGTLDVLAFLDNRTGKVYGKCRSDHTQHTINEVFAEHVRHTTVESGTEQLHYVMDNLATHYSYNFCALIAELSNIDKPEYLEKFDGGARREWLGRTDKRIVIHFTPFHGSWLNSIENWFGILSGGCLRESYASPDELTEAIDSFVEAWNTYYAHPFSFSYTGEGLHQKAVTRFMQMLDESPDKFNNRFLGKQLKLMANLFMNYHNRISDDTWNEFTLLIEEHLQRVTDQILADDKPRRRKNTMKRLRELIELLQINSEQKKNEELPLGEVA